MNRISAGPVERFLSAVHTGDVAAVRAELADDVILRTAVVAEPIVGRDAVMGVLALLGEVLDSFEHGLRFAPADAEGGDTWAVCFEACLGDEVLSGVDLIEVGEHNQITALTATARPQPAIQALGARVAAACAAQRANLDR